MRRGATTTGGLYSQRAGLGKRRSDYLGLSLARAEATVESLITAATKTV
jgi:hypothetical protein